MTAAPLHFEPSQDNTRALRDAFGCFGTGVTVITAQTPDGPIGMTANSFSSISLEPPLVLWSPACASRRHDIFVQADTFCIQILSHLQLQQALHFSKEGGDFARFDWAEGPLGVPVLSGCLAEFHCKTYAVHPAGDHSLILGEVRHVVQHQSDASGLLFAKGKFGRYEAL